MSLTATTVIEQRRTGLAKVPEGMAFLAVSRAHLYSMMDRGALKYVKLGSARRIPWEALYELAARGAE